MRNECSTSLIGVTRLPSPLSPLWIDVRSPAAGAFLAIGAADGSVRVVNTQTGRTAFEHNPGCAARLALSLLVSMPYFGSSASRQVTAAEGVKRGRIGKGAFREALTISACPPTA